MSRDIQNIRYIDKGRIAFDYRGETVILRDMADVVLVGVPLEIAQLWLWKHYGFILQYL